MSTVLGLIPYSGEISIAGHPWSVVDLDRIGASINGPAFYPQLSATDNLKVHAHLTGTDKSPRPRPRTRPKSHPLASPANPRWPVT
ncbi:hypothetical protein [Mycobacterium tuberculosis]|uniref:hypothetical protein n=1 Tax=Mycobacterium tuberculosis TaxID=1773 RepID=UPI0035103826